MTDKNKIPMSLIDEPGLRDLVQVASKAPPGAFVEVGVFKGGSAYRLAEICRNQGRTLHLFDTFEGIPFVDEGDVVKPGQFSADIEKVREFFPDAKIYKGVFPDTLPPDLKNIAFVHIDCDISRTHRDAIEALVPRLVNGGVLYFDDYGNMPANKAVVDGLLKAEVREQRAVWRKPIEM